MVMIEARTFDIFQEIIKESLKLSQHFDSQTPEPCINGILIILS